MVRWSVIGAGGIADRRTIPAIIKSEIATLVAVMDKNEDIARTVGEKYGVPYFTDEEEMLKAVECDAVYIGTPVFCHKEQALLSLRYKRATLLEKPITLSTEEAKEIVDGFKAAGVPLAIGYMMKKHNLHKRAYELIRSGSIGKPVSVRAQFTCWYPDIPGAWRQTKALGGGGAFMDLGVHAAELIEYLLGDEIDEVKSVMATQSFGYEVEDSAIVVFRMKGGALGHIDVNFNIPDEASVSKLEIYGDGGYIVATGTLGQIENGSMTHLSVKAGDYSAKQDRVALEPVVYEGAGANLYEKEIDDFSREIIDGIFDNESIERAIRVQLLTDKIYQNS